MARRLRIITDEILSKFIVLTGGDKVDSGIGLSYTGPPAYVSWRAGTTTLCHSRLYPPQSGNMNWASAKIHFGWI
jgi:hypothetical protein